MGYPEPVTAHGAEPLAIISDQSPEDGLALGDIVVLVEYEEAA